MSDRPPLDPSTPPSDRRDPDLDRAVGQSLATGLYHYIRGQRLTRVLALIYGRTAKYLLAVILVLMAGVWVAGTFTDKVITGYATGSGVKVIERDTGFGVLYEDEKVPQTYEEELDVAPAQLIYENQARAARDDQGPNGPEDARPAPDISDDDREAIIGTVTAFVRQWETFEVGESDGDYGGRLRPYALASALDALVTRDDNNQNDQIGRSGKSGSRFAPELGFSPARSLSFLRYDGKTAYTTSRGSVQYTGPSIIWSGGQAIRTYAVVLEKLNGKWYVARAAAQTLSRIKRG